MTALDIIQTCDRRYWWAEDYLIAIEKIDSRACWLTWREMHIQTACRWTRVPDGRD